MHFRIINEANTGCYNLKNMEEFTSSFPIVNNRYQIFSTIATGGMAVIYKAQDLLLERKVALKILKKELSENQQFQNRFRAEAKASANLNHPNIITTYDFGFDDDRLYIVMEYVKGHDLKELIRTQDGIQMNAAMNYIIQAAGGLSYAHLMGFVHCDVKPQNMLVDSDNNLKITDFGVARAIETIRYDEKHDVVWGSPYYISPEQTLGEPPTPASDVYSLGVIAYELTTGNVPFDAEDTSDLLAMHRLKEATPPVVRNPTIPSALNLLILKSLEKNPQNRFSDCGEMLEALNRIKIRSKPSASSKRKAFPEKFIGSEKRKYTTKSSFELDWQTILLSLFALLTVGGLIPFWIYVIFYLNSGR